MHLLVKNRLFFLYKDFVHQVIYCKQIFQFPVHTTKPYLNRQRRRENNDDTVLARVLRDLIWMLTALICLNSPSSHLQQSERYHLNCERIENDLLRWLQGYHRRIVNPLKNMLNESRLEAAFSSFRENSVRLVFERNSDKAVFVASRYC